MDHRVHETNRKHTPKIYSVNSQNKNAVKTVFCLFVLFFGGMGEQTVKINTFAFTFTVST